jgi:hypothetical protein
MPLSVGSRLGPYDILSALGGVAWINSTVFQAETLRFIALTDDEQRDVTKRFTVRLRMRPS